MADEKDRELERVKCENERLKDDRRKEDTTWREDTTVKIEKLEMSVVSLDGKVSNFLQRQEDRDRMVSRRCEEHHSVLFGSKSSPTSGMFLRLDRLEETSKSFLRLWWIIVGALVTGGCATIWALFHFKAF